MKRYKNCKDENKLTVYSIVFEDCKVSIFMLMIMLK